MLCMSLISVMLIGTALADTNPLTVTNKVLDSIYDNAPQFITNEEFNSMDKTTDSTTEALNTITSKNSIESSTYTFGFQLYPDQSVMTQQGVTGKTAYTVKTTSYTVGDDPDINLFSVYCYKKVLLGYSKVGSSSNFLNCTDSCGFGSLTSSDTYYFMFYNPCGTYTQIVVDDGDGRIS